MLIGIIKEKNNRYYVHLDKEDNISIIHTYKKNIRSLNKDESILFLNNILKSDLTFNKKEDGYDIYLDESNNKRYFKDNKEDLTLFYKNNGKNAILYDDIEEDTGEIKSKNIILKHKKKIILITACLSFYGALQLIPRLKYKLFEPFYLGEDMTPSYAKELIDESTYLTLKDKECIYNEDLFEEVLEIADQNRDYELKTKLKDLRIIYDTTEQNIGGYYYDLKPNDIYLNEYYMDNDCKSRDNTLCHEFIHLLQTNNHYHYINEACAEIISGEYYNTPEYSYTDRVKRVKVLMEIIGPKAVLNCNFCNDTTLFTSSIEKYLSKEDADRLLDLFTAPGSIYINQKDIEKDLSKEIDELLAKMYYNKNQKDINEDYWISYLYNDGDIYSDLRVYFNKKNDIHYKNVETEIMIKENTRSLEEFEKSDDVDKYCYNIRELITKEEYEDLYKSSSDEISVSREFQWDYGKNTTNNIYTKLTRIETKKLDESKLYDGCCVNITLKNGDKYSLVYYNDKNKMTNPYRMKLVKVNEPSIYEKFEYNNENTESKNEVRML